MGIENGEYFFVMDALNGLLIHIRSTVGIDNYSAETGEDSIRCWLTNDDGEPVAPKVARWVTRVRGWQDRMTTTLRYLYRLSSHIKQCPKCGQWKKAKRVKKPGPNRGKVFVSCDCPGSFTFLPDEFTKVPK